MEISGPIRTRAAVALPAVWPSTPTSAIVYVGPSRAGPYRPVMTTPYGELAGTGFLVATALGRGDGVGEACAAGATEALDSGSGCGRGVCAQADASRATARAARPPSEARRPLCREADHRAAGAGSSRNGMTAAASAGALKIV